MYKVMMGIVMISISTLFAQKSEQGVKPTRWSGELAGGWKVAIDLKSSGQGGGSFFWLFDKQPIQFSEKSGIVTMKFRDAWHLFSEDSGQLKMKITEAGVMFLPDGLSNAEWGELRGVILKPGGSAPHQLASFREKNSPYSKYHERAALTLNANELPQGLAEIGIKVFQSGGSEINVLSRHLKMPRDVILGIIKTVSRTKVKGHRKAVQPWQGGGWMLLAIADHPNLLREDLELLWNRQFIYWEPIIWRKVRDHPNADPAWKDEFKKRLTVKTKEGERARHILSRDKGLDLETWDILLEFSKTDRRYSSSDLASHPKLDAERMKKLYVVSPYKNASGLARRKNVPPDLLKKIIARGEPDLLSSVMDNVTAPAELRASAALMLSKNRELTKASDAFSNEMLPVSRMRELAKHLEPAVRSSLARNPNLPEELLKQFADDDYRYVAEAARKMCVKRFGKDAPSFLAGLRDKKTLNPNYGFRDEMRIALGKDDPKVFFGRMAKLWEPVTDVGRDIRVQGWVNTALVKNAHHCLSKWVKKENGIKLLIVKAGSRNLSKEVVDIILSGQPSEELQSQFILQAAKQGRLDLIKEYKDRKLSMKAANKQPLVWYATIQRNEEMIKVLLKMGADPNLAKDGVTPSALAARMNFVPAIKLLPVDEAQKKALEDFKSKYPGDPKAAWIGGWTNGKSEFKNIALTFAGDGNGVLYGPTGHGVAFVWEKLSATKVKLLLINRGKVNGTVKLTAEVTEEGLSLIFPNQRIEKMKRAKERN